MDIQGLPEQFWVVTKPSPVSTLEDICFACTFGSHQFNRCRLGKIGSKYASGRSAQPG